MKALRKFMLSLYVAALSIIGVSAVTGAAYVGGVLPENVRVEQVEKLIHVERPKRTIEELLKEIPEKYGISPLLAAAIVDQESGGRMNAIRYEPSQMARAAKITSNPEQQRQYASSHCALQIMGWWAPKYNLTWSDLYDPETCFEVGMNILANCHERQKGNKVEKIRGALICYNGSEKYADVVLARIGTLLIERNL